MGDKLCRHKVSINEDKVLLINGKKTFPIGFTMAPLPGSKAPDGHEHEGASRRRRIVHSHRPQRK